MVKGDDITLKVLAQMAADNLKPKWISVEDRLPDDYLWVLAYADDAMATVGYSARKGFRHWDFPAAPGIDITAITHWQPLPDPPTD